jgi:AcrR family transcriptional regulator
MALGSAITSKRKGNSSVPGAIETLFATRDSITSGEVADLAGVSRQAAHYHLKSMEARGELVHSGAGRGGRYARRSLLEYRYAREGLEEDLVWSNEFAVLRRMDLSIFENNPNVRQVLGYAFTELLNNAIDHSRGTTVNVRWFLDEATIAFEIDDDGIGVFRNIRVERGLKDDFDAIGEIAKGKQTTAPERHSGLGIYYSSRMVSRFVLSSGKLTWTVDARRNDQAVGSLAEERVGTLVRCEVDADLGTSMMEVFRAFSPPGEFGMNKSKLRVSLFERGDFVSRSEAKRVGAELETYDEVEIDFLGVEQVGQGFVDELFRVWQRSHPDTRLVPLNANPAISALIQSAIRLRDDPDQERRRLHEELRDAVANYESFIRTTPLPATESEFVSARLMQLAQQRVQDAEAALAVFNAEHPV